LKPWSGKILYIHYYTGMADQVGPAAAQLLPMPTDCGKVERICNPCSPVRMAVAMCYNVKYI